MYIIIFKKDYDAKKCIPIMNEDDTTMATFEHHHQALEFIEGHILEKISDVVIIDAVLNEIVS